MMSLSLRQGGFSTLFGICNTFAWLGAGQKVLGAVLTLRVQPRRKRRCAPDLRKRGGWLSWGYCKKIGFFMDVMATARRFVTEGAEFAVGARATMEIGCKEGDVENVLTNVDLAISGMAQEILGPFLEAGDVLVDEENLPEGTPADVFAGGRNLWIIDPIDGTKPYSRGGDSWGVMLAYYDGELGKLTRAAIVLPSLGASLEISADGVRTVEGLPLGGPAERGKVMNINFRIPQVKARAEAAGYVWVEAYSAAEMTFNLAKGTTRMATIPGKAGFWDAAPIMLLAEVQGLVAFFEEEPQTLLKFGAGMFQPDWKLGGHLIVTTAEVWREIFPAAA